MLSEKDQKQRIWGLLLAVVAAALLVPTGVNAAVDAFRLQDGDGTSKAQVDKGAVRVGDGDGAMTVNGDVGIQGKTSSTDAELLKYGDCDTQAHTDTHPESAVIPTGTVVTEIVLGTDWNSSAMSTLLVKKPSVPGYVPGTETGEQRRSGRFLSMQVGWTQGYADFNESLTFGDGVKLDEPWHIYCGGVIGSSQGTALWSVYGYDN